jgi:hypothetical protein
MFVPRHALTRSNMMSILTQSPARLTNAAIQRTFAALIVLGTAPMASRAADCVERPNLQAAQDGHWYYRLDLRNHRRCWYLQQQPSPAEPRSVEAAAPSAGSFLSTLFARPSTPQRDAGGVAMVAAPSAEPVAPRKRHWALHAKWVSDAKHATEPQLEHADPQPRLDPSQREALFQQFLRWTRQDQALGFPTQ